jgi:hypothetical protein
VLFAGIPLILAERFRLQESGTDQEVVFRALVQILGLPIWGAPIN